MKRSVLFLVSLLVVTTMVAAPVSQQRAMQVAQQFIPVPDAQAQAPAMREEAQPADIVYTHLMPKSGQPAFYVVNVGGSFVIVSADDVAHQVLGYNLGNSWPVAANGEIRLPPQVKGFFDDLAAQMEAAIEANPNHAPDAEWSQPQSAPRRRMMSEIPDSVGPLLTTTWDQGQYYNALCPEDQNSPYDGHCPTGCVATAMAQIINYWGQQMPIKTRGIHSYNSNYGTLTVNYDSAHYDFAHMPSALTSTSTPQEIDAVAKLMYDCGVATNMSYGSTESGSYDIDARSAFINHFCFSPNTSEIVRSLFTNEEWYEILHENLAANHPFLYSGQGSGGHSFVCDGYKIDGFYHFNFGWGGLMDGWFLTSAITPGGQYDFSSSQTAIVGIVPDSTSNIILSQLTQGTSTFIVDEPFDFYHAPSFNEYPLPSNSNSSNGTIYFISSDTTTQLVVDIISHEDQNVVIYDGISGERLTALYAGGDNDLSPVVSTSKSINVNHWGNMSVSGYHLRISQNNGCRMVSNIMTSVEATTVHLSWVENGDATQWQIEYGEQGFVHGEGTIMIAHNTAIDITFPQKFTNYDIYIRPLCSGTQDGEWNMCGIITLAPYWHEIVTTQPAGYVVDEEGNIEISTPEGLAWLASVANGLNGQPHDEVQWDNRNVKLTNDIDLSAYRWKPINYGFCGGTFDGQGHHISGLYVREAGSAGLFTSLICSNNVVKDLNIVDCNINGGSAGGIAAEMNFTSIINCSVSGEIYGYYMAGGIVAFAANCEMINCYTNCSITGGIRVSGFNGTGGLIGVLRGLNRHIKQSHIQNCYSLGTVVSPNRKGGLIGTIEESYISNCYSLFSENYSQVEFQELSTVCNNSEFSHDYTLINPIIFDTDTSSNLLDALNNGVRSINTHGLRTWISDPINENMPILGDSIEVVCENASNIFVHNIIVDGNHAVEISWMENGSASNWEIRYGVQSSRYAEICDTTFCYITHNNPDTLYGLSNYIGEKGIINVRPLCDSVHYGGWSRNYLFEINLPCWSEIVTSKPDGYQLEENGDIQISTAEGLAWLISVVNGLNGEQPNSMSGQNIKLINNLDMSQYLWRPIGFFGGFIQTGMIGAFEGTFDGMGHTISGLHISEDADYVGMFASINNSIIRDLTLEDCSVVGRSYVGGLSGFTERTQLINCRVHASVRGTQEVGGLSGVIRFVSIIDHCSFNGSVYAEQCICGGLIGSINNSTGTSDIETSEVIIRNCWSNGFVTSNGYGNGGLIGLCVNYCKLENSYSLCNVYVNGVYRGGGLVGYTYGPVFGFSPIIENCFFRGMLLGSNYSGSLVGEREYRLTVRNCYAIESNKSMFGFNPAESDMVVVNNLSSFNCSDSIAILSDSILVDSTKTIDLLEALNLWVRNTRDDSYFLWEYSTDSVLYPYLSTQQVVPFINPVVICDTIWENGVRLKWNNIDGVLSWDIEYGVRHFEQGTGSSLNVTDTIVEIDGLVLGEEYDFYVRSNYVDGSSKWSKVSLRADKLYWKDIVNTQPADWSQDDSGNIYINSPEALAWLITLSTQWPDAYTDYTIHIMKDINIGNYKWTPLGHYYLYWSFEGHGHTISGLYIDEKDNEVAFIHTLSRYVKDLYFDSCFVRGVAYVATICHNNGGKILNCGVRGKLVGNQSIGGVVSLNSYSSIISNTYSNCELILNSFGAEFGGFCADNYGKLENCYSSARIAIDTAYYARCQHLGIFTGEDYSNDQSDNLAYWFRDDMQASIPGCSSGSTGYHSFSRQDSLLLITNPITIDGYTYQALLPALNAWVDANNSDSIYRHWVADTAGVNGGFPIFAPMPKYVITFFNSDSSLLQRDTLEYGAMPVYRGEYPVKPATAQYTYIFKAWSPVITSVTEDATYTATFDSIVNRYVIIFQDEDSTLLQRDTLDYGAMPEYRGATPTKQATVQYTYTFAGWAPTVSSVTQDANYIATFDSVVNTYVVMFLNDDSTLLQIDTLAYGAMPEFHGATPIKQATAQYTYTFNGWNNAVVSVTGDAMYVATYVSMVNKYVVMFMNEDSTLLQIDTLAYGVMPVYRGQTPSKASTAQYTYSFAGWTPAVVTVTQNATYTATYTETENKYVVIFQDMDGTQLQVDTLNYGLTPVFRGTPPTKENTAQYSYSFAGWTPQITEVTGNITYTAKIDSVVNKYVVMFLNEDSTLLQIDTLAYGAMPEYRGATPTKQATAQYTYTFNGWNNAIVSVTGDVTYLATYLSTTNKYLIIFQDEDGTPLQQDSVEYGALPAYRGTTPTKAATVQYTYSFAGWNNAIVSVTGNATYLATYLSTTNKYLIIFQDEDGTPLQQDSVEYGLLPAYTGPTPAKLPTAQYTYTFSGWSPTVVEVTGPVTYTATYSSTINQYSIAFLNYDGTELQQSSISYGVKPTYNGATPTKPATAQYTYTFKGWDKEILPVAAAETYVAQFDSVVNKYLITFKDEDGTTLQQDSVEYGLHPAYRGETPTKPSNAEHTYFFGGWTPTVVQVTENATYTATYTETVNKYVVLFQDEDGTILQRDSLDYGTTPIYRGEDPTKESTAEATFTFVGWTPSITAVVEDVVYTATYDSVVNTYVVMFLNEDSTLLQIDTLEYGAMPEYRGEDPVKPNEGDYFYVFTGWEPEVVAVVGDAVYIATYESHGTGFDNVAEKRKPVKVMEDGKMYILMPDGTKYSATGKKVE